MTGPQSRLASRATVIGSGSVLINASSNRVKQARNFPMTKCHRLIGCVSTCSSVPLRRSSLHIRMVKAAQRKIRRIGIHSNSGRISAMLRAKKDSTQKKRNSVTAAKDARNNHATGDEKKSPISFWATRRATELVAIVVHLTKYLIEIVC